MALTDYLKAKKKKEEKVIEPSDWHNYLPKQKEEKPETRRILAIGLNGEKDKIRDFYALRNTPVYIDEADSEESAREYMKTTRNIDVIIITDAKYDQDLYKIPFIKDTLANHGHSNSRVVFYGSYEAGKPARLGADSVKEERDLLRLLELYETGKVSSMPELNKKEITKIVDKSINPRYFAVAALQQ